jgi:hypothetical protein
MRKTIKAFKFLFIGPFALAICFVVDWMTTPGQWWVHWAALGIGIAWVIALVRVLVAIVVAGGLAAFFVAMRSR